MILRRKGTPRSISTELLVFLNGLTGSNGISFWYTARKSEECVSRRLRYFFAVRAMVILVLLLFSDFNFIMPGLAVHTPLFNVMLAQDRLSFSISWLSADACVTELRLINFTHGSPYRQFINAHAHESSRVNCPTDQEQNSGNACSRSRTLHIWSRMCLAR